MESFLNSIKDNIENMVDLYTDSIVEKFGVDKEELKKLWIEVSGGSSDVTSSSKPKSKPKSKSVSKNKETKKSDDDVESVESDKTSDDSSKCPYKFTKGKNPGSICGCKPKKNSVYCSKHQKYEEVGQPVKKVLPKPTEKTNDKPVEKPEKILRKNSDIDKWWTPHTKMVFKSSEELIVIGVCNNKKISELSNDDIATCRKYGFKYETISKEKEEPKKKAVEKKELPIKKTVDKKEQTAEKSKISVAINKTNLSAKDVEDVLSELKLSNEDDDDEYIEDEEENIAELEVNVEEDLEVDAEEEDEPEEEEEYEEEEEEELLEDEE